MKQNFLVGDGCNFRGVSNLQEITEIIHYVGGCAIIKTSKI